MQGREQGGRAGTGCTGGQAGRRGRQESFCVWERCIFPTSRPPLWRCDQLTRGGLSAGMKRKAVLPSSVPDHTLTITALPCSPRLQFPSDPKHKCFCLGLKRTSQKGKMGCVLTSSFVLLKEQCVYSLGLPCFLY